jgi:hypothetical protein
MKDLREKYGEYADVVTVNMLNREGYLEDVIQHIEKSIAEDQVDLLGGGQAGGDVTPPPSADEKAAESQFTEVQGTRPAEETGSSSSGSGTGIIIFGLIVALFFFQ